MRRRSCEGVSGLLHRSGASFGAERLACPYRSVLLTTAGMRQFKPYSWAWPSPAAHDKLCEMLPHL